MNENIHSLVGEYVQKCNDGTKESNNEKAKVIWYEVSGVFGNLIPGYFDYLSGSVSEEWCLKDLPRIVGKLRVYSAKLEHETMIARLSQPITTMNQNTTIDINATFTQATSYVMDSESFSPEETSEILIKIKEIKRITNSQEDNQSKWEKVKPILEWAIKRGVEIAPVIIQLASLTFNRV